jgi:hypothetical protein
MYLLTVSPAGLSYTNALLGILYQVAKPFCERLPICINQGHGRSKMGLQVFTNVCHNGFAQGHAFHRENAVPANA